MNSYRKIEEKISSYQNLFFWDFLINPEGEGECEGRRRV
jgi:hypothetical protein